MVEQRIFWYLCAAGNFRVPPPSTQGIRRKDFLQITQTGKTKGKALLALLFFSYFHMAKKIQGLFCCLFVLMVFGDLFLAVKAEESLPAFVPLSTFCLAGETEIGDAADMFITYLFFAIIAEVRYITDMP